MHNINNCIVDFYIEVALTQTKVQRLINKIFSNKINDVQDGFSRFEYCL